MVLENERQKNAREAGDGVPAETRAEAWQAAQILWRWRFPFLRRATLRPRNRRAAEVEEPADRRARLAFSCGAGNDRASIYACQACNTDAAAGAMAQGPGVRGQSQNSLDLSFFAFCALLLTSCWPVAPDP